MRQERTVQASLFDRFADHEIGRELKAMSQWLDAHRDLTRLAAEDLRRPPQGRLSGLSAEPTRLGRPPGGRRCWPDRIITIMSYVYNVYFSENSPRDAAVAGTHPSATKNHMFMDRH